MKTIKALIVEDCIVQSTSLKMQLKRSGITNVDIAESSKCALRLISANSYHIAFVDLQLQGEDSLAFLRTSIAVETISHVVIISKMALDVIDLSRKMCSLLGYNSVQVLSKPIRNEDVCSVMLQSEIQNSSENPQPREITTSLLSKEEIALAFDNKWFENYYQPQISADAGNTVSGVEVLTRLNHPNRGIVSPESFLPLLKDNEGFSRLFDLSLEQSLKDFASSEVMSGLTLSINIEQSSLEHDVSRRIIALCEFYNFAPERLILELTESETLSMTPSCLENLARLRMHNIGLALEDFGTGYSSYLKLTMYPFTELKIDRSFIDSYLNHKPSSFVVNNSVALARLMGLTVIAEGIEDNDVLNELHTLGIDRYQGYFFSRPLPFNELAAFLERH